uniref:Uncharacterized protein n=1 Tax=Anguilla anguilla TaxID=7936 RepID=A0A0E9TAT3_ANGAN
MHLMQKHNLYHLQFTLYSYLHIYGRTSNIFMNFTFTTGWNWFVNRMYNRRH